MEAPSPQAAAREAILHWSGLPELAVFAVRGHGFGDNDGGFGVTYPGDLDDYDRASGEQIPDGFVLVYGFWGPPDGYKVLVPELSYLAVLEATLSTAGHVDEAATVRSLAEQKVGPGHRH